MTLITTDPRFGSAFRRFRRFRGFLFGCASIRRRGNRAAGHQPLPIDTSKDGHAV
jgi:hypothetical protein